MDPGGILKGIRWGVLKGTPGRIPERSSVGSANKLLEESLKQFLKEFPKASLEKSSNLVLETSWKDFLEKYPKEFQVKSSKEFLKELPKKKA